MSLSFISKVKLSNQNTVNTISRRSISVNKQNLVNDPQNVKIKKKEQKGNHLDQEPPFQTDENPALENEGKIFKAGAEVETRELRDELISRTMNESKNVKNTDAKPNFNQ